MNDTDVNDGGVILERVPHLEQYLGVWAMYEPDFNAVTQRVQSMNLHEHIEAEYARQESGGAHHAQGPGFELLAGGVALIEIIGTITKYGSSLSANPGTLRLRKAVRAAVADRSVSAIVLKIDSPGGNVAGTDDLAREIAAAVTVKTVVAYIEDMGASGAYWLASQATRVVANATAKIGAIGVYGVLYDYSAKAEREGIAVHVIKTGEFKGVGVPGTVITKEQLAEAQRTVTSLNAVFMEAVAAGRQLSAKTVASLADGRVHIGADAAALGLIDAVETLEETLADVRRADDDTTGRGQRAEAKRQEVVSMSTENTGTAAEPKAATLKELKAAFPDSDPVFREGCLEEEMTLAAAKDAWSAKVTADLKAAETRAEKAEAAAKEAETKAAQSGTHPGVAADTVAGGGGSEDVPTNAITAWNEAVNAKVDETRRPRHECARLVGIEQPSLRKAYAEAYTAEHAAERNAAKRDD